MSAAPDLAEAIVGWRAWHVVETDEGPRLHSVGRPTEWAPRATQDAACLRHRRWRDRWHPPPAHAPPDAVCGCGVWACKDLITALQALDVYGRRWRPVHRVVGQVAIWGTVIEHERGWRAGHGYPISVSVPDRSLTGAPVRDVHDLVAGLQIYGVPVTLVIGGSRQALMDALGPPGRSVGEAMPPAEG